MNIKYIKKKTINESNEKIKKKNENKKYKNEINNIRKTLNKNNNILFIPISKK